VDSLASSEYPPSPIGMHGNPNQQRESVDHVLVQTYNAQSDHGKNREGRARCWVPRNAKGGREVMRNQAVAKCADRDRGGAGIKLKQKLSIAQ